MVRGISSEAAEEAEKKGAKKAVEDLTPKEQASLEATGRSDQRSETVSSLEDLRQRSRRGDLEAVVERLKNIPPVGKG